MERAKLKLTAILMAIVRDSNKKATTHDEIEKNNSKCGLEKKAK
jgi:hypothetical protein